MAENVEKKRQAESLAGEEIKSTIINGHFSTCYIY
jgi:hypothetical protein